MLDDPQLLAAAARDVGRNDDATPIAIPGFHPVEAYEAAIANLAPELIRRPKPETVADLLHWASQPLATAEVSAIMQLDATQTRAALSHVAQPLAAGADCYWRLSTDQ